MSSCFSFHSYVLRNTIKYISLSFCPLFLKLPFRMIRKKASHRFFWCKPFIFGAVNHIKLFYPCDVCLFSFHSTEGRSAWVIYGILTDYTHTYLLHWCGHFAWISVLENVLVIIFSADYSDFGSFASRGIGDEVVAWAEWNCTRIVGKASVLRNGCLCTYNRW